MKIFLKITTAGILLGITNVSMANNALSDPTKPAYLNNNDVISTVASVNDDKHEDVTEFELNAIKISRANRFAIINGEPVYLGEFIGNARVVKINSSSVVMDIQGKTMTVSFLSNSIKKLTKNK